MQRIQRISGFLLLSILLSVGNWCAAQPKRLPLRLPKTNAVSRINPGLEKGLLSSWQKYMRTPKIPSTLLPSGTYSPLRFTPRGRSIPVGGLQTPKQVLTPITQIGRVPRFVMFPGKKDIDAVIFDLDGTLLDSLSAWEHSGSNFVRSQGFEPPEGLDEKLVKMSLLDGANLVKEMYGLAYTPEEILEMTLRPIKNHYYQDIQPMPGVPELLARLKAQGVKMAVATASHKEFAQAALLRLGLADYFEFIVTCDEVGIGKTSPRVYEVAAERLGTSNERTLVVEDALHALETASQAGFKTAAIEEKNSAHQRAEKQAVADYYVISYQGQNTLVK